MSGVANQDVASISQGAEDFMYGWGGALLDPHWWVNATLAIGGGILARTPVAVIEAESSLNTGTRQYVLGNIADSQASRLSSNFGVFIRNEGQVNELLGIWPPNNGAYLATPNITLDVGMQIDRYGYPGGSFVSPLGTSFGARALPSSYEITRPYFQYEVIQPIAGTTQARALPWFGQPGMGTQFQLPNSVQWYIDNQYFRVRPR